MTLSTIVEFILCRRLLQILEHASYIVKNLQDMTKFTAQKISTFANKLCIKHWTLLCNFLLNLNRMFDTNSDQTLKRQKNPNPLALPLSSEYRYKYPFSWMFKKRNCLTENPSLMTYSTNVNSLIMELVPSNFGDYTENLACTISLLGGSIDDSLDCNMRVHWLDLVLKMKFNQKKFLED